MARGRDIGQYLGVVGPWAWVLFGLYVAVYTTIALVGGAPTAGIAVTAGSLGCVIVAALLIASPSPTPLPRPRLIAIGVLAVAAVLIMYADLPLHLEPLQMVSWQLGAINFVLFVLELRGRIVAAWVLMALIIAISAGWSIVRTGSAVHGLELSYGQAVSLVAGTIFAIGLHRTARLIFAQQDAERTRAAAEASLRAGDAHRAAELAEVRALAGPLLQRIAADAGADPREAVTLEAALRDRIRGRALAIEPLIGALHRARERGADALLLDDLGDATLGAVQAAAVAQWCTTLLDSLDSPRVTIRIAPADDGALVSVADADGIVGELAMPRENGHSSAGRDHPGTPAS